MTNRRAAIAGAVVALAAFVAFAPSIGADFVTWDDDSNFLKNPLYRGLGWEQLRWMWTTFHLGHWIPLSWMTLGLDYVLWGMHPAGYHLTNVVLHAIVAVVLVDLSRTLLRRAWNGRWDEGTITFAAAATALLWAVHPLRVESVAWITERRDMLSLLFYLLSLRWYFTWASLDGGGMARTRGYVLSLIAFAAALLCKGTSVTLPAVVLILNVYPLHRLGGPVGWWSPRARRIYLEVAPFAALSAAFSVLSIVALDPPKQLPFADKVAVSAYSLAFYLLKTIVPTRLAALYEMPKRIDPFGGVYLASYGIALALLALAFVVRRRRPGVTAAIAAFVAMIFPLLGVVQNGPQIAADRYTYHAMPALMILAGAGLATINVSRLSRIAMLVVLTIGLTALTWVQLRHWKNSERLWSRVLEVGESSIARTALANVLLAQNRLDEAIPQFRASIALDSMSLEADNNLGIALARQGKFDEAMAHYRRAIVIKPDHYEAHNNLGVALAAQGQLAEAIEQYSKSLAINPDYADAHVNWGNALTRLGRPAEAIPHYEKAAALRPDMADVYLNWGVALAQLQRLPEAIDRFNQALRLDPGNEQAIEYLQRANSLARPR